MIVYGKQSISKKDIGAVAQVLRSDHLTQGPQILAFEQALAKYCGAKYAITCNNGTAALHLSYLASGLKKGDEVIVSPNTFASPVNMLISMGIKPVFCDIRLDTYNIDEVKIQKLINEKTKAIVSTYFAGHPAEMDVIYRLAKKNNLLVITDACHALGAKFRGNKVGSCRYAHLENFSFHPVKPITTAEGGAILTNSKKFFKRLVLFRNHGIFKNKKGKNIMIELGFNYRLTDMQAALGISQLKRLNKFIKARHQIVKYYQQELREIKDIILPRGLPCFYSGWHLYVIRVKDIRLRDKLMIFLRDKGIGVNFHYPAVYSHPYYRKHGFKNFSLSNTEVYHKSCITLPCHTLLHLWDIKYIGKAIKEFYEKNN